MSNPKKPVSPKQLAANRVNASHSTGPRTREGKARSAQNSRKHGFTATNFAVVRLEDLQEVDYLRADLIAIYQPVNSQELFAIERIALAQQALLRIARLESGLLTSCLNDALDTSGQLFIPVTDASVPRRYFCAARTDLSVTGFQTSSVMAISKSPKPRTAITPSPMASNA